MSALATKFREAYQETSGEASRKWATFDQKRKDVIESGVDPTKDAKAFEELHELHKDYAETAALAKSHQENYARALDMDGERGELAKSDDLEEVLTKSVNVAQRVSAGSRFTESDQYKALLASGAVEMEGSRIQMDAVKALSRDELIYALQTGAKTLLTGTGAPGTELLRNERLPGMMELLQAPLQLVELLTIGATDANVIEWVRQTSITNNAAEVAEATATGGASGTKPESAMAFVVENSTVRTIAHWIPATRQALSDMAQLRTLIDAMLVDGVRRRLNGQVLNGNGTAPNLRGILNTVGIGTQARGTDPGIESILKAITTARLAFMEPDTILMHPTDYQNLRLAKDANGNYIFGPPSSIGFEVVWGLKIVKDVNIAQGTALVGDFSQAILYVREGVNVTSTDSHSDFFVRNMIVVLAEGRYALAVPRPQAFVAVTGL